MSRAVAFASKWGLMMHLFERLDMISFITTILKSQRGTEFAPLPLILISYMYVIWLFRNNVRFGGTIDLATMVKLLENWVEEFMGWSKGKPDQSRKRERKDCWG